MNKTLYHTDTAAVLHVVEYAPMWAAAQGKWCYSVITFEETRGSFAGFMQSFSENCCTCLVHTCLSHATLERSEMYQPISVTFLTFECHLAVVFLCKLQSLKCTCSWNDVLLQLPSYFAKECIWRSISSPSSCQVIGLDMLRYLKEIMGDSQSNHPSNWQYTIERPNLWDFDKLPVVNFRESFKSNHDCCCINPANSDFRINSVQVWQRL